MLAVLAVLAVLVFFTTQTLDKANRKGQMVLQNTSPGSPFESVVVRKACADAKRNIWGSHPDFVETHTNFETLWPGDPK